MSNSLFIARMIGPVMLIVGLAAFVNQRGFRDMAEEFLASRALMFLSGLLLMPVGIAIVLTHNIWTADWRVLITIFGWINVIASAVRLLRPPFLIKTGHTLLKQPRFIAVAATIWVVVGLLFCFFGYLH